MESKYQEAQRARAAHLIGTGSPIFYGDQGGGIYRSRPRDFMLINFNNNFFEAIRTDVIEYFKQNTISWWGEKDDHKPSGHVLSSQIACLNHLFFIRNDKDAVLGALQNVSKDFTDVSKIESDDFSPAFIQFEAVSDTDHLNEKYSTRGSNCTSIDALICAVHKNGSKWLIPIEWKYTEFYNDTDKATEMDPKNPQRCKGEVRKGRYTELINKSDQLKSENHACYYYEPFYQLMRQTLWAEQMILHKNSETIKADDFLHLHVIPYENKDLLEKKYKCSGKNMEKTWRDHLKDQSKYVIITPENILAGINGSKYGGLLEYLKIRYW